jgi:hypothetical protein
VSAARAILNRGFGKSGQNVELEGQMEQSLTLPEEVLSLLDGFYMHMR